MSLDQDAEALLFDFFKGQITPAVTNLLHKYNSIAIHALNNDRSIFQPLNISVNKSAKCFFTEKYQDWYANKVLKQLTRGALFIYLTLLQLTIKT